MLLEVNHFDSIGFEFLSLEVFLTFLVLFSLQLRVRSMYLYWAQLFSSPTSFTKLTSCELPPSPPLWLFALIPPGPSFVPPQFYASL